MNAKVNDRMAIIVKPTIDLILAIIDYGSDRISNKVSAQQRVYDHAATLCRNIATVVEEVENDNRQRR